MMRQTLSKFNLPSIRLSITRGFADKKKPCSLCPDEADKNLQRSASEKTKKEEEPLCKHHAEMLPEFDELKNMKKFELKSDCNKFHWISEGHC